MRILAGFACMLALLAGCGQPLRLDSARATRSPLITATTSATSVAVATEAVSVTPEATREATVALTREPTSTPAPTVTPTPAVQIVPQTARPLTSEERWRSQQIDRQVYDPPRLHRAVRRITLFWYDPGVGQVLEVGDLIGDFPVQARFSLRSSGEMALEVPYRINNDFGLTAISEAVRSRMEAAGYTISVEAFVLESDAIQLP